MKYVLNVEDQNEYANQVKEICQKLGDIEYTHVSNLIEATNYIKKTKNNIDLFVLDANFPITNGNNPIFA